MFAAVVDCRERKLWDSCLCRIAGYHVTLEWLVRRIRLIRHRLLVSWLLLCSNQFWVLRNLGHVCVCRLQA